MKVKEKFNKLSSKQLAEFIHLNICNSCHFCIFFKTKDCKINVRCEEGIEAYLNRKAGDAV